LCHIIAIVEQKKYKFLCTAERNGKGREEKTVEKKSKYHFSKKKNRRKKEAWKIRRKKDWKIFRRISGWVLWLNFVLCYCAARFGSLSFVKLRREREEEVERGASNCTQSIVIWSGLMFVAGNFEIKKRVAGEIRQPLGGQI
jgi:hypothetical protein